MATLEAMQKKIIVNLSEMCNSGIMVEKYDLPLIKLVRISRSDFSVSNLYMI